MPAPTSTKNMMALDGEDNPEDAAESNVTALGIVVMVTARRTHGSRLIKCERFGNCSVTRVGITIDIGERRTVDVYNLEARF